MSDPKSKAWYPVAAYLYVLHLDGPELAWEYLRRHQPYRDAWEAADAGPDAGRRWGLALMEDPSLDARQACPAWLPGQAVALQLQPDPDPAPLPCRFTFWDMAGRSQMVHDGRRMLLTARLHRSTLRLVLGDQLVDGLPCLVAMPAGTPLAMLRQSLGDLAQCFAGTGAELPSAMALPRPTAPMLLEMHTLQALDGVLCGASQREIAAGLFGDQVVMAQWYPDSDLRARVRRLVRRGRSLMQGGYLRLAQLL